MIPSDFGQKQAYSSSNSIGKNDVPRPHFLSSISQLLSQLNSHFNHFDKYWGKANINWHQNYHVQQLLYNHFRDKLLKVSGRVLTNRENISDFSQSLREEISPIYVAEKEIRGHHDLNLRIAPYKKGLYEKYQTKPSMQEVESFFANHGQRIKEVLYAYGVPELKQEIWNDFFNSLLQPLPETSLIKQKFLSLLQHLIQTNQLAEVSEQKDLLVDKILLEVKEQLIQAELSSLVEWDYKQSIHDGKGHCEGKVMSMIVPYKSFHTTCFFQYIRSFGNFIEIYYDLNRKQEIGNLIYQEHEKFQENLRVLVRLLDSSLDDQLNKEAICNLLGGMAIGAIFGKNKESDLVKSLMKHEDLADLIRLCVLRPHFENLNQGLCEFIARNPLRFPYLSQLEAQGKLTKPQQLAERIIEDKEIPGNEKSFVFYYLLSLLTDQKTKKILKKYGVFESRVIFGESLQNLSSAIQNLYQNECAAAIINKRYKLVIESSNGGHAFYFSLNPLRFSDPNVYHPLTFEPIMHEFSTIDQLLNHIVLYVVLAYTKYQSFSLYAYHNLPETLETRRNHLRLNLVSRQTFLKWREQTGDQIVELGCRLAHLDSNDYRYDFLKQRYWTQFKKRAEEEKRFLTWQRSLIPYIQEMIWHYQVKKNLLTDRQRRLSDSYSKIITSYGSLLNIIKNDKFTR